MKNICVMVFFLILMVSCDSSNKLNSENSVSPEHKAQKVFNGERLHVDMTDLQLESLLAGKVEQGHYRWNVTDQRLHYALSDLYFSGDEGIAFFMRLMEFTSNKLALSVGINLGIFSDVRWRALNPKSYIEKEFFLLAVHEHYYENLESSYVDSEGVVSNKWTGLMIAIKNQNLFAIQVLFQDGNSLNKLVIDDEDGAFKSALSTAVFSFSSAHTENSLRIIDFLLQNGADQHQSLGIEGKLVSLINSSEEKEELLSLFALYDEYIPYSANEVESVE